MLKYHVGNAFTKLHSCTSLCSLCCYFNRVTMFNIAPINMITHICAKYLFLHTIRGVPLFARSVIEVHF